MASVARVLGGARRRGWWRQIQTAARAAGGNQLAAAELTPELELGDGLDASSPRKARLVLELKLEKLVNDGAQELDQYSKLISFSEKLNDVPLAMKIFTAMESQGIRPNTCIFNSLVLACLSTGNVVTALSLFEIMERTEDSKPNLATYNAFISMYSKLGYGQQMMRWYLAAKKAGFSPDTQTYEFLIGGSVKLGKLDDANHLYKEMLSSEILPNLATFELLLGGLCNRKDTGGIRELLKHLVDGGWHLSSAMVEKLLLLYSELGQVDEMEELLLLEPSLHSDVLPRIQCGIIRLHALGDRLDDMEYSIRRMLKGRMMFTCPEDVEAVICSYFRQKAFGRLDLFLDMIKDSHKFRRSTYDILVSGYRRFELYKKLDLVIVDMQKAGLA